MIRPSRLGHPARDARDGGDCGQPGAAAAGRDLQGVELPKPTVFASSPRSKWRGWSGASPAASGITAAGGSCARCGRAADSRTAPRAAILEELVEHTARPATSRFPTATRSCTRSRRDGLAAAHRAGRGFERAAARVGQRQAVPRAHAQAFARGLRAAEPASAAHAEDADRAARAAAELERIREQGYATDDEEYLAGICCLAVPVHDADGRVVAALAMHSPVPRLALAEAMQFLPAMQSASEAMAQTLDW